MKKLTPYSPFTVKAKKRMIASELNITLSSRERLSITIFSSGTSVSVSETRALGFSVLLAEGLR